MITIKGNLILSLCSMTSSQHSQRSVNDAAILYFSENGQKTIVPSPEKLHALFDNRNSFHIATGTDDEDAFDDVLDWAQTRLETYETNDASGELMAILAGRVSDIFNRTIDGVNFRRVMRQATRIKCVGISNWTFTLTDGCTKLIRALNAEKDVEMLFLDPNGKSVALRAEEERKDTRGQVIASFDMLRSELHSHFKGQAEKLAHLKMYTFDMIPRDNLIFISEEYNSAALKRGRTWIIDPIDGTCNLTHGIPTYAVQCALFDQGEIKLSAIYFPFNDELFTACRDGGARLNGNLIKGVNRPVNRALVSFGDFVHTNQGLFDLEHQIMQHVAGIVERIRMYGAASIDFAYAACGRLDGSYTFVKNPWDILPGIFLCREAGLQVCDAYGEPYTEASDTVAVFSTPELMEACTSPLRGRANCPESHSTNSSTVGAAPA